MAFDFEYAIYTLEDMGIVDVILPFIIIFTVVFAALQKSKILGKESKKYNVVIALALAFGVVIPHVTGMYPAGGDIVEIMNSFLPQVSLVALAFVMVMMILGIIGGDVDFAGTSLGGIMVIVSVVVVAVILAGSAGWFQTIPYWLDWLFVPETRDIIVILLVFGIIIGFITKEDKPAAERKGFGDFLKGFTDMFPRNK